MIDYSGGSLFRLTRTFAPVLHARIIYYLQWLTILQWKTINEKTFKQNTQFSDSTTHSLKGLKEEICARHRGWSKTEENPVWHHIHTLLTKRKNLLGSSSSAVWLPTKHLSELLQSYIFHLGSHCHAEWVNRLKEMIVFVSTSGTDHFRWSIAVRNKCQARTTKLICMSFTWNYGCPHYYANLRP